MPGPSAILGILFTCNAHVCIKEILTCFVLNDAPPPVTGFDGRVPVVIGLAAQKSYLENRPVQLGEI